MNYVKLFGGPWDGRRENVVDGCPMLRLAPPVRFFAPVDLNGNCRDEKFIACIYRRSPDDPSRFVYEGMDD